MRHSRPIAVLSALGLAGSLAVVGSPTATAFTTSSAPVFISELHYDNTGTDVGEFVEVTAPAGTSLSGWSVVLYNGSTGAPYNTLDLSALTVDDEGAGFGAVDVQLPSNGLQNGAPDGLALVDDAGSVVEFWSYEGTFTAVGGPADGVGSTDLGVSESGGTAVGASLSLSGTGNTAGDFTWTTSADDTPGVLNVTFGTPPTPDVFVSEFHYDNVGSDTGEFVEVAGPAGTALTDWSIVLYNGSNGAPYNTLDLSALTIDDEGSGEGAVDVQLPSNGLQNGSPDGIALVAPDGTVVEFWSYEGDFTAVGGPADGVASTDVGVSEPGSTPIGQSLQLIDSIWTGPAAASPGNVNAAAPPPPTCPAPPEVTLISQIQGSGAATPCAGEDVIVEAVVVADFEGPSPNLRGFYLQEEDADSDGDASTSEGIFVFNFNNDDVEIGDQVRVAGTAGEFQDQTQISSVTEISPVVPDSTTPPAITTPATATLPLPAADSLESVEGMLVNLPQTLYATEYFQLGRFGQVVVSSGDRLDQPTTVAMPGAAANAVQAANDLNRLIIDDTTNDQNPEPIIYGGNGQPLTAANPLRGGDTLVNPTGVMTYTWAGNRASGNAFRLRPAGAPIEFSTANPRPTEVPDVGGDLTVVSFNVLNYFLTIDEGSNVCGPDGFEAGCRGADSAFELERQRAKLLAALDDIEADVFGLVELENTTGVEPLADIVDGLNGRVGAGTYDYVETGTIGTDVIKVGFIYRTDSVQPVGSPAVLDNSVDPDYRDDLNRPALAVTFMNRSNGELLTVVNNHFKSKSCRDATGLDQDQGDGQGCYNPARTAAAEVLAEWLGTDPTGVPAEGTLIIGDLNSYAMEDPIQVLAAAGYTDLAPVFDDEPYSFVFDGQWGYLDYALASPELLPRITGAAEYHINADEPNVLDYNTDFQSPTQIVDLYAPDQFRTSDHDPVIVGIKELRRVPRVKASIADTSVVESEGPLVFEVSLNRPTNREVKVVVGTRWVTRPGAATKWVDFIPSSAHIYLPAGETSAEFVVPVIDDDIDEPDEKVYVRIQRTAGARKGDRKAVGTIIDDDSLTVNIVHINDHHSHLDPDGGSLDLGTAGGEFDVDFGGFPAVVSKFAELEAELDNVVKVHAGDAVTGTLYYSLFKGQADADLMNEVCFDMFALGNHEFDDSDAGLAQFLGWLGDDPGCDTPVLAANVVPAVGTPLRPNKYESLIQPYTVLEIDGQQVGFIGIDIAQKTQVSSSPLETTRFLDEVETAKRYVRVLRRKGVENIVLVTHQQYRNDIELAAQVPGIDAIIGGDSHTLLGDNFASYGLSPDGAYPTQVTNAEGDPVCIVQAWQYSWVVGELNLTFDQGKTASCGGTPHLLVRDNFERDDPIPADELAEIRAAIEAADDLTAAVDDPDAAAVLEQYSEQVDELTQQVVGSATEDLCLARLPGDGRSSVCAANEVAASGADRSVNGGFIQQIVTDGFLARAFRADMALQNAGGVRVDIPSGEITIADVYTLLPFANTLVELELTGAEVSQVLEEAVANFQDNGGSTGSYPYGSALRWDLDLSQPFGSRFSNVQVRADDGTWSAIDPAATYVVATNSFIASGRDGYLTFGKAFDEGRVVDTFIDYAQGFIDYIEQDAGGVLSVPAPENFSTQSYVPA